MNQNKDLEERDLMIEAFEKFNHVLTNNQKQVMHLYYIEDLSLAEIAEILATSRSNVFDTLSKARKKIIPFLDLIKN